jgi:hypothetical protein
MSNHADNIWEISKETRKCRGGGMKTQEKRPGTLLVVLVTADTWPLPTPGR